MEPVDFEGRNVIFAKDQPQYRPLPAHKAEDGIVTTCWEFSFRERLRVLFGTPLLLCQHTFNTPLQPVMLSIPACVGKKVRGNRAS
jgi:hypothetical protein